MIEHRENDPEFRWELAAESITVRIRWFGLCVGYALVNWVNATQDQAALNAILTLGAIYTMFDTWWSFRGRVFLSEWPLLISSMEAIFIGLLCYFDSGPDSLFRFYYFLSVLVCAVRYSRSTTYTTFVMHVCSVAGLMASQPQQIATENVRAVLLMILLGWVTWASTSLAGLIKRAGVQLQELNLRLTENQGELELRIAERTRDLQESQALLVQQEKQAAFGLLAAGIAHEVGNPLAAISSLVQMLRRRPTDDYTNERLQMVDEQLVRIQRTLRELVDFSRPATSARSRHNIHDVINAALNIAKYYKRKKGKQIETDYNLEVPPISLVRDQLVQVFLNLILNAMDATDEGEAIHISTDMDPDNILVRIRDTGHGIPAKDAAQIFQPYFTTKPTGTGLGLFVCRNILESSGGGQIELEKTGSEGTTFCVYVPLNSPEPIDRTSSSSTPPAPQQEASSP